MKRQVHHSAKGDRLCECGAKFRDPTALRKHIHKKAGPREIWVDNRDPNLYNPSRGKVRR